MAGETNAIQPRLSAVRWRYKISSALGGLLLLFVEGSGLLLLLLLIDLRYAPSGTTRVLMLLLWLAVLAALGFKHVIAPLLRKIPDEAIALLIEERSPNAQGTVISAVEFGRGEAASRSLVRALVADAADRLSAMPLGLVAATRRLGKYGFLALFVLLVSGLLVLQFPDVVAEQSERIFNPWQGIEQERIEAQRREAQEQAKLAVVHAPIEFEVRPGDQRLRRGSSLEVEVRMTRAAAHLPQLMVRTAGEQPGEWQALSLSEIEDTLLGFKTGLHDINDELEYYVEAGEHRSEVYRIGVFDPLALKGIELTYHYPKYMELAPETVFGKSGDINVPEGTKIKLRLVANQALSGGKLAIQDGPELKLKPTAGATEGVEVDLDAKKDFIYGYEVTSAEGETIASSQFSYLKVIPDLPPAIKIVFPKLDMSVHPLSEVTVRAEVSDDFGVKDVIVSGQWMRATEEKKLALSAEWEGKGTTKRGTVLAEYVLRLDEMEPKAAPGDLIFYHVDAVDMKGQKVSSDEFYLKVKPLEICAVWPSSIQPIDYNHPAFNRPMELIMFIAAAWALEQERGQIKAAEFNKKSEDIAERMLCTVEMVSDIRGRKIEGADRPLAEFFGSNLGVEAAIVEQAEAKVEEGWHLLMKHEPGKAADVFRRAFALIEGNLPQGLLEMGIAPDWQNLGMGAGDYKSDPLLEHVQVHAPSMMSDDFTFYQNEDNFPHMRPPDYRRKLALRALQAAKSKQLKELGVIYRSQEDLIKKLQEGHHDADGGRMIVDGSAPVNREEAGGGSKMEKIDERIKPVKKLRESHATPDESRKLEAPPADPEDKPKGKKPGDETEQKGGSLPLPSAGQAGGAAAGAAAKKQKELSEELEKLAKEVAMNQQNSGGGGGGGGSEMPKGDESEKKAVDNLRQAADAMKRASDEFKKGNVRQGLALSKDAQKKLEDAKSILGATQTGDLREAMSAAEEGAAKVAENQRRIGDATQRAYEQAAEKAGKRSGKQSGGSSSSGGAPSQGEPGEQGEREQGGQPSGQSGNQQAGKQGGKPSGKSQGSSGQQSAGQQGGEQGEQTAGQQGGQQGEQSGQQGEQSGQQGEQSGQQGEQSGQQGKQSGQQGKQGGDQGEQTAGQQGGQPSGKQAGKPGEQSGQPGGASGEQTAGKQGGKEGQPGGKSSGKDGEKSASKPGGKSGGGEGEPSDEEIRAAVDRDPALQASAASLFKKQAKNAEDLKSLGQYLGDLKALAERSGRHDVAGALDKAEQKLRETEAEQKMVDASIDLAQGDFGRAARSQQTAGEAVDEAMRAIRQAGEVMSGSKLGIMKRAAKDAKQVADKAKSKSKSKASQGQPKGGGGGGSGSGLEEDLEQMWTKTQNLAETLETHDLAEPGQAEFLKRSAATYENFKKLFDNARAAEAHEFAEMMEKISEHLEKQLAESMEIKKLNVERRAEYPPKFRDLVNKYYEALSRDAK